MCCLRNPWAHWPSGLGVTALVLTVLLPVDLSASQASPHMSSVSLDHVWIMVSPGAPERGALTRAGFEIAPGVNRNDGQGTASISIELENAYIELMWPDSSVAVQPGLERAAEKFRQRMLWRTSGWCPIGIALRHTTGQVDSLPFETWSWSAEWMPKGAEMVMLTPRDDKQSPAMFIEPRAVTDATDQASLGARFHHRNGLHRITKVRLMAPMAYEPITSLEYLRALRILTLGRADQWRLELTFDGGKRKRIMNLRPELPIVVRY